MESQREFNNSIDFRGTPEGLARAIESNLNLNATPFFAKISQINNENHYD